MKKKLPIGIQYFPKLIEGNFLYVDKTEFIYKLLTQGSGYYFLSRPRRFGKSLLLSTLEEIFRGNRALFQGLWIQDRIDWQPCPVINLNFSEIGFDDLGLVEAINRELDRIAGKNGIQLSATSNSQKFRELIQTLGEKEKVAILIDEYDKPIIQHILNLEKANENRDTLKNFYSVIKDSDEFIRFFLITGVSKFSHVSIFSDLNNLEDISLSDDYAQMLGYTDEELTRYFHCNIEELQEKFKETFPEIRTQIREWYNGYSWNGEDFVYNPFSILNLFKSRQFKNFWFQTGTPTFLMKLIRAKEYPLFDLEGRQIDEAFFNKSDILSLDIYTLLFQTGYLTMKAFDLKTNQVTLDFPNEEVRKSFYINLIAEFTDKTQPETDSLLKLLQSGFETCNMPRAMEAFTQMFSHITYPNIDPTEKYYHSTFYMAMRLLGYQIQSEVTVTFGQIDCVVRVPGYVYVIEFKMGSAKAAMKQIKEKRYYQSYLNSGAKVMLLGIGFDRNIRNIGDYEVEEAV